MIKKLLVTVSGEVASGKSRVTYLLKEFLKSKGFDVKFEGNQDFPDEESFDKNSGQHIDKVIEAITKDREITFQEIQLQRGSFGNPLLDELSNYQKVNKCETLEELAGVIRSFADGDGMIQGRRRGFDAEKMAKACENYCLDYHNVLTREFGIRQQAMYILTYEAMRLEIRKYDDQFKKPKQ